MKGYWKLRLLLLAVFLILALAGGFALVGAAPTIPNNSDGFASAAHDPVNDRYLLVFEKSDNDDRDIWARFVSSSGDYLASEFPVITDTPHERQPAVAFDSVSGDFLAVWQDYRNGNWDIYGQFIDGDTVTGKFTGSDFAIADSASLHSYSVDLAFDEDTAKFLVVWHDEVSRGSKHINGQFVNTASAPSFLYSVNFPISTAASDKNYLAVANDPVNNRFLTVWGDRRSGLDIYGQMVDSASGGGFLYSTDASTNLPIATGAANSSDPDVAYSGSTGRFMVVWTDGRDADGNIYGQLIDAGTGAPYGTSVDTNFPVSTAPNTQLESAVTAGPAGNYLVVFRSVTGPEYDILGQLVDGEGSAVAVSTDVNYPVADSDEFYYRPGVVYNPVLDNYLFYYDNESVTPYEVALLVMTPLTITKAPPFQTVQKGESATFTITVENLSSQTLTGISVSDPLSPDCDRNLPDLPAMASTSYTCQSDPVMDEFVNTARVDASYPTFPFSDSDTVSDSDTAIVDLPGGGGGGGGGCNTTGPAPGEPMWVDLLWIAMLLGMFILVRRKSRAGSRLQTPGSGSRTMNLWAAVLRR